VLFHQSTIDIKPNFVCPECRKQRAVVFDQYFVPFPVTDNKRVAKRLPP
jgi:hypothetical protein